MNPYYYLFYIFYKYIKCSSKNIKISQEEILSYALANFFFFIFTSYVGISIATKFLFVFKNFTIYYFISIALFAIGILLGNRFIFRNNNKYLDIEEYFDKTNKLTNTHFIIIAIILQVLAMFSMVGSGIYYTTNH